MKAVILAGGLGTRISEESALRPKPMIEIGGRPILWHIMKIYSHYGVRDFIICLGYKGYMIKEYFANYVLHNSDVTVDIAGNKITYHQTSVEPWKVTLVDTGESTMTGGRLKRIAHYLNPEESFCLTYGDGVADVDITGLIAFHRLHKAEATVTAVIPPSRFGALELDGAQINRFAEKPAATSSYINGGFFVLQPKVLERIADDTISFEHEPLESLARDGQLMAFCHTGFWQPMDTLRDKNALEAHWQSGNAPWKIWE